MMYWLWDLKLNETGLSQRGGIIFSLIFNRLQNSPPFEGGVPHSDLH